MAQGFYDLIGSMFSAPDQWVSDGSYRTTSPSLPANVPTPMSVRGLNAVGDFIPGYGDVKAIGEAGQALSQGELLAAGLLGTGAAIGLVPGAGDALARPVIAAGRRVADAVPSEAIYAGRSLAEGDFGGVLDAFTPGRPAQSLSAMSLWHGSPYDFDKFDLANVGRGEGAQDLGRGFSLTDEQGEAILYSNPASRWGDLAAMEKYRQLGPGRYYKVDVNADPEQFLDWNAPWRSQVKDGTPLFDKMLEQERELMSIYGDDPAMVEAIPQAKLSRMWKDNAGFEDAAAQSGFVGNRRRNYSGDTEYTVFDPENLSIAEKFDADGNIIGLLSDPAAQRGDEILGLLSSGRAADVTDEMLDMGDPVLNTRLNEYLFNNYDLPMDEASRMSRAQEMGFGGGRYHGSNMDFPNFSGSAFTSDNPTVASTYNRGMQDAVIYPLMTREGVGGTVNVGGGLSNWNQLRPDMIDDPYVARELDMGMPISTRDIERQAKFEGFSGANFNDINDLGPGFNSQQFKNIGYTPEDAEAMRLQYLNELSAPSNVDVRFYPNLSRSRFARFDPRLSHLRNLSAGMGAIGLLSAMDRDQLQQDTRNYLAGGA